MAIVVLNRPSIVLKPIEYNYTETDDNKVDEYTDQIGKTFYITYQGLPIDSINIHSLSLKNNQFIPTLEMEFDDPTNKIMDEYFPLDDSVISLYKKASSDLLFPIRMDFKIVRFNPVKKNQIKV